MNRIRTIKPEFRESESMGNVSRDARLLFVMLWTVADDEGRLRGSSRLLASTLFPYDEDARNLIDGWLEELVREHCIQQYEVDGKSYIEIVNWLDHQKIDRPSASRFPPAPVDNREDSPKAREDSPSVRGSLDADLGRDLGKDLGGERKGEREREAPAEPAPASAPREPEKLSRKPKARFAPPTLEEVAAYCRERGNRVDPGRWLAYYESNGWHVGKNSMRDWRAAVRTWEGNGYDRPPGKPAAPAVQETEEQRALREKARRLFGPKALRETVGGVP